MLVFCNFGVTNDKMTTKRLNESLMIKIKSKARHLYLKPTMEVVSIMDSIALLAGNSGENTGTSPGYSGELGAKPNNFPMFDDDELYESADEYDEEN